MKEPTLTIVTINWNGLDQTQACIRSLLNTTYSKKSIVVVDNGSRNHEADRLKAQFGSNISVLDLKKNLGFAGGNNRGAQYAMEHHAPDYFLFLNNDTEVDPGFLEPLVETMEKDPQIAIAGPKVLWKEHPNKILFAGGRIRLFLGEAPHVGLFSEDGPEFSRGKDVDYVEGSALCYRRSIAKKLGLFDENFFAYWEDTDLCARVREAGYRCVFAPEARVYHKVSQSTGGDESPISIYYISRNRYRFMKKHARWFHVPSFVAFTLAWGGRTLLRFAFKKNFRAVRTYLIGSMHGIRGVTGEIPQNLL